MADEKEQSEQKSAADLLHTKRPLQPLRTYQGDVAEAIKSQNESVATIAIKEKLKKEEREPIKDSKTSNFPVSMVTVFLGLILLAGSVFAILFVFRAVQSGPQTQTVLPEEIIPTNSRANLLGINKENILVELQKISGTGVVVVDLQTIDGAKIENVADFLKLMQAEPPSGFVRNLQDFVLGVYFSESGKSPFLILRTKEFGLAFSGLLEWEDRMRSDLSFFERKKLDAYYVWRDLIIKNKDVRALANLEDSDDFILAYTFLDKETILITNSPSAIADMSALYASRAVAR